MKTPYIISRISIRIIASLFMMLIVTSILHSQCNDVTLSTQKQVDNFTCSSVTGNLTIEGVDITNLDPIASAAKLSFVRGNLTIQNCPKLESLQGLDLVGEIGGWLVLNNNQALSSLGGFSWSLKTIEGAFGMEECPKLTNLSAKPDC